MYIYNIHYNHRKFLLPFVIFYKKARKIYCFSLYYFCVLNINLSLQLSLATNEDVDLQIVYLAMEATCEYFLGIYQPTPLILV